MPEDDLPPEDNSVLRTNAWCGEEASSVRGSEYDEWGMKKVKRREGSKPLSSKPLDYTNWKDPRIGWGIVLPDNKADAKDKARALDAPECIQKLLAERDKIFAAQGRVPVFRYRSDLDLGLLRRYAVADGKASDPGLGGERGVGPNAVPWYLLIVGSPEEIPWRFQYNLQLDAFVGRLDLDAPALERYVEALLNDWSGSGVNRSKPVVWAVDHGVQDITRLMRRVIADRLVTAFRQDPDGDFDMTGGVFAEETATHTALAGALAERRPAFVAMTSHGATAPLNDTAAMSAQLGLPLDDSRTALDLLAVPTSWPIYGSILYAHACCSAGCDTQSAFTSAATPDSTLGRTLAALEKVRARTAPLPKQLLGGTAPARAFIGHVEPTFAWTLRDPRNNQVTTPHIVESLYGRLHQASRPPIGYALAASHTGAGRLWREYLEARDDVDDHVDGAIERVRRAKLVASDREAMVLLGDPTVRCG